MSLHPGQHERGFTLLELIVVCALIGIMLSVSVPSLRMTFYSDPLKSTARNLIGLVSGVRELAVRHQQSYFLHISEAERRIWYEMESSTATEKPENRREHELILPETVKISEVQIDADELKNDHTMIWISKQGYIQRTRIRIEDEEGRHLIVQFFPFLDSVTIADESL